MSKIGVFLDEETFLRAERRTYGHCFNVSSSLRYELLEDKSTPKLPIIRQLDYPDTKNDRMFDLRRTKSNSDLNISCCFRDAGHTISRNIL